jgi:dihydroorotate dehydrogenase (fumarate)
MDMTTDYLGLTLKNPLIASSSPLTWEVKSAVELQQAGIAAIIMPSLFEEQIDYERAQMDRFVYHSTLGHAEADSFHPDPVEFQDCEEKYLSRLKALKQALDIPVIASLNGVSDRGWVEHAQNLQQAGADGIELNIYYIAAELQETSQQVEQRYLDIFSAVKKQVNIPVSMKLSNHFSALLPMITRLQEARAAGISLFNRFYQPDIDLETLLVKPRINLSSPEESLMRIRWTAILRQHTSMSLAITGGMHDADQVLKGLLAGADACCLCSTLLKNGPQHTAVILDDMLNWLQEKEYESIHQLKGSLSYANAINPSEYERANYRDVLNSY